MDKVFLLGNVGFSENENVAYVIGDAFGDLSVLPNVYTVTQFFKAVFEGCLPTYRTWIVGQGIDASERKILRLCEAHQPNICFHFGEFYTAPLSAYAIKNLEWRNFQFIDSTRVHASLRFIDLHDEALLAGDFLVTAARELTEQACRQVLPHGQLMVKHVQINRFHQLFPLPVAVETLFQLTNDNKRSLKSLTRFYQDYSCAAEVSLSFDLYSAEEMQQVMQTLAEKTFGHFSSRMDKGT